MARKTLIEYTDKDAGKVIKLTKDKKGRRRIEVDMLGAVKSKLEAAVEEGPLKKAFSWAIKDTFKDYHVDEIVNSVATAEGLRIEESNGDFYVIEMPEAEAHKFIEVINSSTDLLAGVD
ncbi:hypothetical protein GF325_14170 [Candidatus Bathyarchaeota archaeon]|nr:hypothetical protein [Candidatus Bathyarchaeota archaeon]